MKINKKIYLFLIVFLFILCGCENAKEVVEQEEVIVTEENIVSENVIHLKDDDIMISKIIENNYIEKKYEYKNDGTTVSFFRATDDTNVNFTLSNEAKIRYSLDGKKFLVKSINEKIQQASCYYIDDKDLHLWIYMPKQYHILENHSIEFIPKGNGKLEISMLDEGYSLSVLFKSIDEEAIGDFIITKSNYPLFKWDTDNKLTENYMKSYNLDGDGRFCYDGYYFPADSSYYPHGKNVYYFCVDSYIINSFMIGAPYYLGCKVMLAPMIDIMLDHQNNEGFIPTYSESSWLLNDYEIGKSFYDTRFNTDFFRYVFETINLIGGDKFERALKKYAEFYIKHAENNKIPTENGYFVSDYYNPSSGKLTHASLNHNLAEFELCLLLSEHYNDAKLFVLAFNILNAIRDTKDLWIMKNNNLEYAILPDLSFGFIDYPYLTYNDLYDVQSMLENRGFGRDSSLDELMQAKKAFMDAHMIKEYKK